MVLLGFRYPEYLSSLTTEIFTDAAQQQAIPVHIEETVAPEKYLACSSGRRSESGLLRAAKANNLNNARQEYRHRNCGGYCGRRGGHHRCDCA
jgi:hypothetical protein